MWTAERRLQRREFKDYQPLFMLINSLDFIDHATRREFACIKGEVWRRYNALTKNAAQRRITALFLSDEHNLFHGLLFVGGDCFKKKEHRCATLWADPDWPVDDASARHLCITLSGRSILHTLMLRDGDVVRPGGHSPVQLPCALGAISSRAPFPTPDPQPTPGQMP